MTRRLQSSVQEAAERATLAIGLLRRLASDPLFGGIQCRLRGAASALSRSLGRLVHDDLERAPKILPLFPHVEPTDHQPPEPA